MLQKIASNARKHEIKIINEKKFQSKMNTSENTKRFFFDFSKKIDIR